VARSTHAVGAVLAACLLSAPSAAQEHVEIDLTDLAGRRTAAAAASRDLEQQPQETLDVYLRLPADSELRVELPEDELLRIGGRDVGALVRLVERAVARRRAAPKKAKTKTSARAPKEGEGSPAPSNRSKRRPPPRE